MLLVDKNHINDKPKNLNSLFELIVKYNNNSRCVDNFCDPMSMSSATVADLMICAPWDTQIFSCLADGKDHTPCCSRKAIPPICQV